MMEEEIRRNDHFISTLHLICGISMHCICIEFSLLNAFSRIATFTLVQIYNGIETYDSELYETRNDH